MTDEFDSRPLDDRLPDCEPDDESPFDAAQREAQERLGVVERDGALIDAERDWFTVSGLRARLAELSEHLAAANRDRSRAEQEAFEWRSAFESVGRSFDICQSASMEAIAACKAAAAERDALQIEVESRRAELAKVRGIVEQIKQRPLTAAVLIVVSKFFRKRYHHVERQNPTR